MTDTLLALSVVPNPIRLHELVALEEGYFTDEGLAPEVQWKDFYDLMGVWADFTGTDVVGTGPAAVRAATSDTEAVASACQWGTINVVGGWNGQWFRDAYAISRHAIYVRPDSSIRSIEDLANVEIGVGWLAGSHFNVYYRLDGHIPLDQIKPIPVGGYGRRLEALLNGEIEAASLLDPQIFMAEELGLRSVVSGEFECLFWVDEQIDSEALRRFFRALDRAESAMQSDMGKYLPLWEKCIPKEFRDRKWDTASWSQGTRFVMQPYTDEQFTTTMGQIERWGLDGYMKTKDLLATTRSCF